MGGVRRAWSAGTLALLTLAALTTTAAAADDPRRSGAPDGAAKPLAEAPASATARRTGRRVELTSLRSETGQVFVNPDGTKTMEQHALPVRVRQGSRWVRPDPTLRSSSDGSVRPVATVSPLVLSGGGSKALLAIGKPGARLHLGWPARLPRPSLHGATATYPEVLPGVDLRITVEADRFAHLLVVKTPAAAAGPALRRLRYPIRGDGVDLAVRRDGSTVATDRSGKRLFVSEPPAMWDSSSRTAPRRSRLGIAKQGSQLLLTPDRGLLANRAAKYPLFIDPSFSGTLVNWLHVNERAPQGDGWTYDRNDEGAKVGRAYQDTANLYRSMFLLNTASGAQTIAGSTILSAQFRITVNKSPDGTPRPVELWHLTDLDTGNRNLHWGTTSGYWRARLDTRNGEAWPFHEDNPMEFGEPDAPSPLRTIVQAVADQRKPTVSLGLKAPDEGAQLQWKKFHPHSAVLVVRYNTVPKMPKGLTLTRPRPCGTAAAPTPIPTGRPQWAAVATDPDSGDNLITTLQIRDTAGTAVHEAAVGPAASGAAFAWPEVPEGKLSTGKVYSYSATTRDVAGAVSPSTPPCYFVIDTTDPAVPQIVSADFPDGQSPVTEARRTGTVTFKPGGTPADTDVAEYVYGFKGDTMASRVRAGADGTATIPITMHPDPDTGVPSARLYVRAVDRAGNHGPDREAWELRAKSATGGPARVRGDTNGDGKADVTAVFDHGFGRTGIWNINSTGSGFHTGLMTWDTGAGTGFSLAKLKPVQGDFDGNGRTDMAVLRSGAGRQLWLYELPSDGNEYQNPKASWTSPPNSWPLTTARVISGDVDGDQKDDIVVQNAGTADNWQALVFRAGTDFAAPVTWAQASSGNSWSHSTPLIVDLDGDGLADLLSVRNLTGCRTTVDLYRSTGTGFAAPSTIFDSGAGGLCWDKSRFSVADPDGDGRDDVVALVENGPADASLVVLTSDGARLAKAEWRRTTGLELAKVTLLTGDYDGDRRADVGLLYAADDSGGREVHTLRSTGTSFEERVRGWSGAVGAVTGPKFDLEHRQYELVNKNSGKCLNVHYAGVDDGRELVQFQCQSLDLNARFRLMPIPGTDQYSLRPAHTAVGDGPVKCADVLNGSADDGAKLVQHKCGGGLGDPYAWQQVTFAYVDGSAYDTVVQLKLAHSGKCVGVENARLDDRAPIIQQTCGQATSQQWILRPAFNPTQLGDNGNGRYRTEAATGPMVLDITDCQKTPGSQVRMFDWIAGSPCQKWKLESLGDDIYRIVDPNSAMALEIQGCSKLPRATVHAWPSNSSECQRWRIEPTPDGSHSVIAVGSGMSLDVAGCSALPKTEVITWFYHGGKCQRWFFEPQ